MDSIVGIRSSPYDIPTYLRGRWLPSSSQPTAVTSGCLIGILQPATISGDAMSNNQADIILMRESHPLECYRANPPSLVSIESLPVVIN